MFAERFFASALLQAVIIKESEVNLPRPELRRIPMTISWRLKLACLVSVLCAFTMTACPTGQNSSGYGSSGGYGRSSGYGSSSSGSSLGGPGSNPSGSMGGAAGGGAAGGGAGGGR